MTMRQMNTALEVTKQPAHATTLQRSEAPKVWSGFSSRTTYRSSHSSRRRNVPQRGAEELELGHGEEEERNQRHEFAVNTLKLSERNENETAVRAS